MAPSNPASGVVVTSMPWRRSPTAMAFVQFSSRWKRIVLGIGHPCLESFLEPRGLILSLLLVPGPIRRDLGVDLFPMVMVVGQGGVDPGQSQMGELGDDLLRADPLRSCMMATCLTWMRLPAMRGLPPQVSGVATMCSRMTGRVPTIDGDSWDGLAVGSMSSIVTRSRLGRDPAPEHAESSWVVTQPTALRNSHENRIVVQWSGSRNNKRVGLRHFFDTVRGTGQIKSDDDPT